MTVCLMILLTACTTEKNNFIVPCYVPPKLEHGSLWRDLVLSYIDVYHNLEVCAEKVRKYNE